MRYLVIGDIHGEISQLGRYEYLFDQVDKVIFVGDYVDRGANSIACLKFVLSVKNGVRLIGNHEWKYYKKFLRGNISSFPRDIRENDKMKFWDLLSQIFYRQDGPMYYYKDDNIAVSHAPALLWQHDFNDKKIQSNLLYGHTKEERDKFGYKKRKPLDEVYSGEISENPIIYGHIHGDRFKIRENEFCVDFDCGYGGPLAGLLFDDSKIISAYLSGKEVPVEYKNG